MGLAIELPRSCLKNAVLPLLSSLRYDYDPCARVKMTQSTFQDRIQRINAAQPQKEAMARHLREQKAKKKRKRSSSPLAKVMLVPMLCLVGFVTVVAARAFMYHQGSQGLLADIGLDSLLAMIGGVGIEMVVTVVVTAFLLLKGSVLMMVGNISGGYLGIRHEHLFMKEFPDVWAMIYSPGYVQNALAMIKNSPSFF